MTICIIFLPNCTEFVQRNWPRIEECMDVFDELRIFRQICKCECGCHCWIDGRKTRTFFPFSAAFLLLFGTPGFWGTCSCWWTDTRNDEKLRPGNAEMKMRRKHKAISADLGENLLICHTKRYFHLICICCLHPKSWKKKKQINLNDRDPTQFNPRGSHRNHKLHRNWHYKLSSNPQISPPFQFHFSLGGSRRYLKFHSAARESIAIQMQ